MREYQESCQKLFETYWAYVTDTNMHVHSKVIYSHVEIRTPVEVIASFVILHFLKPACLCTAGTCAVFQTHPHHSIA